MKIMNTACGLVLGLLVLGASRAQAQTWSVDPVHSTILFRIQHFGAGMLWGRFNEPAGTINWDAADPSKCSFDISVKATNLDTHNSKRDEHLRGPDFFNAKQYPEITFKSTSVKKSGESNFEVAGDLTIRGTTKPITAMVEVTGINMQAMGGHPRAGFEATFKIKRSEFGVSAMPGGVGEDVSLIAGLECMQ